MSNLNEDYIIAAEEAILTKLVPEESMDIPSISCQYYDYAIEKWELIQSSDKNFYYQFADNALGMQSFGFYKANNGKIYIIDAFLNEIRRVYIPSKKIDCLKDLIKDDRESN